MLFDIALALGLIFAVAYALVSMMGLAITIYLAHGTAKRYRQAKLQKKAFQAHDGKIDTTRPAGKGFRQQ